jgi:hypothetical protein
MASCGRLLIGLSDAAEIFQARATVFLLREKFRMIPQLADRQSAAG